MEAIEEFISVRPAAIDKTWAAFFFLLQTALVLKEDGLVQGNVRQIEREEKERGRKK